MNDIHIWNAACPVSLAGLGSWGTLPFQPYQSFSQKHPGLGVCLRHLAGLFPGWGIILQGLSLVLTTNCSHDYTYNDKEKPSSCLSAAGTVDLHCQCKRFKSGLRDKLLRVSLSVSPGRFRRALTEGGGLTLSVGCTILWARILDGVKGQETQAQHPRSSASAS